VSAPEDRPAGARTIAEVLEEARSHLQRIDPQEAAVRARAGAVLVDTRPASQRDRDGAIPGALVIERNHLEWRFDPASDAKVPEATGYDVEVVLFCDEGYSSSLAADALQSLGLHRATDVIGGFQAWKAAGLPVIDSSD
jgi:rhodanese-related sulfurtransferase